MKRGSLGALTMSQLMKRQLEHQSSAPHNISNWDTGGSSFLLVLPLRLGNATFSVSPLLPWERIDFLLYSVVQTFFFKPKVINKSI